MAKKTIQRAKVSLNIQHDYITLKLPVGNFTTSYGGAKASGELAGMKGAFAALDKYVQERMKNKTAGEAMQELTNPELLDQLVPGWDKPTVVEVNAGDTVKFTESIFTKKYPSEYEVHSVKNKYAYLKVPSTREKSGFEVIGFAKHVLTVVKKK